MGITPRLIGDRLAIGRGQGRRQFVTHGPDIGRREEQDVAVGGIGPLDEELPDHPGTDPEGLQDRGVGRPLGVERDLGLMTSAPELGALVSDFLIRPA